MLLHNTLTRNVEEFTPETKGKVRMYTCGITVYSQPHIGNWLAYVYSDVLVRTLMASGFDVERTQNITDVGHLVSDDDGGEDKLEKGARAEGLTAWQVAEKYIAICDKESKMLGLLQPTHVVRATDLIDQQIQFVKDLEAKGFTYVIDDGVYFDTSKLDDYGKLARLDIEGLEAGARVDVTGKRNKTDFALWKLSPAGEKRDMEWESPWGTGFPGWHLECSVIARETLGDQIDLHTGGIDHIPVHHTNEIAQTESLTEKKPFSRTWFHNNHIKVNGTKISKSLGNIYTLQDILDKGFSLDAFKLMVLSSHYRTEGNFTWEILEAAQNRLDHWRSSVDLLWQAEEQADADVHGDKYRAGILDALQNDLDTPEALALIDRAFDDLTRQHLCKPCIQSVAETIEQLLGIDLMKGKSDITDEQKQRIHERESARMTKDWSKSDDIRDELRKQGIELNDTPTGPIWSRQ